MTTVAEDTFTRTVASGSGWGTADTGGAWTQSSTAALGVDGSKGYYTNTGSVSKLNHLASVSQLTKEVAFDWSIANLPGTGENYSFWGLGRLQDASNYYRLLVILLDTGAIEVRTQKVIATAVTSISVQTSTGRTYVAGDTWKVRFQFDSSSPTTLRIRTWKSGDAEPGTWDVESTDSEAAFQSAGSPGVRMLPSAAAYLTTFAIDNLLVVDTLGGGPAAEQPVLLLGGL